jgi:hypothetical protein|nr:MAG TPA: hypothetical protein [Caudoviricetes sp.]
MSVDNQKLLQKIVEELESLKGETEVLSIAISCLFSEMPTDSASKVRAKFIKTVNELNTLNQRQQLVGEGRVATYIQKLCQ